MGALGGGVLSQHLEGHDFERARMRGGECDWRVRAALDTFEPARGAHAPPVAGLQAGEFELRPWRREVVADLATEREKVRGHLHAHRVAAVVLGTGVAAAVAKKSGHRLRGARLERAAKDVACGQGTHHVQQITIAPGDARSDFHNRMATIYETLRADIITAMKARDSITTTALRTADAAIKRAAMDTNKEIDDALAIATVRKAVKNLADAIVEFEKGGRADLVSANQAEIRILEKYLPKGLDVAKLDALIAAAIVETGAASKKEMGKVIGALKKHPDAALIDFGAVSKLVQAKLP